MTWAKREHVSSEEKLHDLLSLRVFRVSTLLDCNKKERICSKVALLKLLSLKLRSSRQVYSVMKLSRYCYIST